jgi:hypothetical protein
MIFSEYVCNRKMVVYNIFDNKKFQPLKQESIPTKGSPISSRKIVMAY